MINNNSNTTNASASATGEEFAKSWETCPLTHGSCAAECAWARFEGGEPFCGVVRDIMNIAEALENIEELLKL